MPGDGTLPKSGARVELVAALGTGDPYVAVVTRNPNPLVTLRTVEEPVTPVLLDLVGQPAERSHQSEPEPLKAAVYCDLTVDLTGEQPPVTHGDEERAR